jgi:hypothetical protein
MPRTSTAADNGHGDAKASGRIMRGATAEQNQNDESRVIHFSRRSNDQWLPVLIGG